jgi:hypothetical protein
MAKRPRSGFRDQWFARMGEKTSVNGTIHSGEPWCMESVHARFGKLRHEVAYIAVEPELSGLNPMFCHRYPTRTCGKSNLTV